MCVQVHECIQMHRALRHGIVAEEKEPCALGYRFSILYMYFCDWEWEVILQCWMSEGMVLDLTRDWEMWRGQILQARCLSTAQVRWSCRIQKWPWDVNKIDQVVSEEWRWPHGILYVSHGQFEWDVSISEQWETLEKSEEVTKVLLLTVG